MAVNKVMVTAGVFTIVQAVGQIIFTALGVAQYFCLIDFLRRLPILVYIKVLYFHNPGTCGSRVNIGEVIDELANQAFILVNNEPFTVTKTFLINVTSLSLSVLWFLSSIVIMMGGAKNQQSKWRRWPWIIVSVAACAVDVVATVTYANDSFHTRTLSEMMDYIGATASGTAGIELDTSWTSWIMVIIYSRLAVLFFVNLFLIITVVIDYNVVREPDPPLVTNMETSVNTNVTSSVKGVEEASLPSETPTPTPRIPRPGLSQSFRRMKTFLFRKPSSVDNRFEPTPDFIEASPERSPREVHVEREADRKRTVNFPVNLLSLPQRLENMIAEQQRRLDKAVIDTAGRRISPRISQSLPQLPSTSAQPAPTTHFEGTHGRRGTAAELQGQLPWAYIPASAHRMRDQLPPDEDLPPVPLPDYTAIPSFRKASVHRAASSLSSLTQKRDYFTKLSKTPLQHHDVLY